MTCSFWDADGCSGNTTPRKFQRQHMAMDINYHPSNNGDINLQHMGASTNPPPENLGLQHFQVVSEVAPQLFQAGWDEGCHGMRL